MTKFNVSKIAEKLNIPNSTLHDFKSRNVTPSKRTIDKIFQSLNQYCNFLDSHHVNTGKLSTQEVEHRVKLLGISKCPKCGEKVKAYYSRFRQNHFLGCQKWRKGGKGCKWTRNLFV